MIVETDGEIQRCPNCDEEFAVTHLVLAHDGSRWRQVEATARWCPFCRNSLSLISEKDIEAALERFITRNADALAEVFAEAFREGEEELEFRLI